MSTQTLTRTDTKLWVLNVAKWSENRAQEVDDPVGALDLNEGFKGLEHTRDVLYVHLVAQVGDGGILVVEIAAEADLLQWMQERGVSCRVVARVQSYFCRLVIVP